MLQELILRFGKQRTEVNKWLFDKKQIAGMHPFYASCDIRNSGYKIGVVDTNLFPAGFNNICEGFLRAAHPIINNYFSTYFKGAKKIGILTEEHTRNIFYIQNVEALSKTISESGYSVQIFNNLDSLVEKQNEVDCVIVNNDFSGGLPDKMNTLSVPLIPPPQAGWHTRQKNEHFFELKKITNELAQLLGVDPWLLFPETEVIDNIDINDAKSRELLAQKASEIINKISINYKKNGIESKPYLYIKDDSGTYGIGIETVEDASEILSFNKKRRATFKSGKNKKPISSLLIQEGIPSSERVQTFVSEPVVYMINNTAIGGFFRMHEEATERSSLNRPGMQFSKLCFHETTQYKNSVLKNCNVADLEALYFTLGACASIAAAEEIKILLQKNSQ